MKKELIESAKLDDWLRRGKNVIFYSKHGVGKTSAAIAAVKRAGLRLLYLSASTCDPWIDFVGIPRVVLNDEGKDILQMVPRADLFDAEVILIDEFNRAPKKVRNACMELIQFRAINGKPLENLRCVWTCCNPEDEQDTYDVEPLDPAQEDRFQIKCYIPYQPCESFFTNKYGEAVAESALKWWHELPEEHKDKVSPRRLDYALAEWSDNGDLRDVLPQEANVSKLIQTLVDPDLGVVMQSVFESHNDSRAKSMMLDNNLLGDIVKKMKEKEEWMEYFLPFTPGDVLSNLLMDEVIVEHVIKRVDQQPVYSGLISSICELKTNMDQVSMIRRKYANLNDPKPEEALYRTIFGNVNIYANCYYKIPADNKIDFRTHIAGIKSATNDFSWDQKKTTTQDAWNRFIDFIPKALDINSESAHGALALMEAIASEPGADNKPNFFMRYEQSLFVLNTLAMTLCYSAGEGKEEIFEFYPHLNKNFKSLPKVSPDHAKMSFLRHE